MLSWTNFPTDEQGFFHNPVLLWGAHEALLIYGVFRYSEARRIGAELARLGRSLTTIHVSCNDPDFYFGLKPLADAFAQVRVIGAPTTVGAIAANVDGKLAIWRERLGEDGPDSRAALVLPRAEAAELLMLEGERIEIVIHPGLFDRRTLWVPSLRAVVGGTMIVSGCHVWIADTPGHAQIAAWIDALELLLGMEPEVVVPGHLAPGGPTGVAAIEFTRAYFQAFEVERAVAADAAALIAAMIVRYPDLGGGMWLELGAKVAMGEMAWG